MSENAVYNYHNTCSSIDSAISELDVRIRVSEQNKKLKESYESKIKILEDNIVLCNLVLDSLKPMLADVQTYIAERKKSSMENINNALRMAGEIIQDATEGIFFNVDGDEAWLSTPDGLEVDMVEGGGYRQISSTFIRSVILDANMGILNTMLLDEIFSLVSPENSSVLSLYLNVMCQDKQVISIEQKPQVYSNIDNVTYVFDKSNDYASVSKIEVKREDVSDHVSV